MIGHTSIFAIIMKFFKNISTIIILFVTISVSSQVQEDTTLFFDNANIVHGYMSSYNNGWYVPLGESTLDTLTFNNRRSLLLSPSISDPAKAIYATYYIRYTDIDADSIVFSGKYQYSGNNTNNLSFGIQQCYLNSSDDVYAIVSAEEQSINKTLWSDFSVKTKIMENIHGFSVYIYSVGECKLWINNCKVKFDGQTLNNFININYTAEDDHEFDDASEIQLNPLKSQRYIFLKYNPILFLTI
jgi:hypothetical protein